MRSMQSLITIAVALFLLTLACSNVHGQWEQTQKLTADDGAAGDYFGSCTASAGENIIVVGTPYDDDAGDHSGSVYVFDATTGQQLHKLAAGDAAEGDEFGRSVSVSGNTIIAGAPYDDDAGSKTGSAYVFDATTGEQLHKLTADDAEEGDRFGYSVSISGNTIVIGAYLDSDAGANSGSAYVFDAIAGEQLHKLYANDAQGGEQFGHSVLVSEDIVVVGAPVDSSTGGFGAGSAYLFDAATGEQLHKLYAEDTSAGDAFGYSVSIGGNIVVIGAPYDDAADTDSGSAYMFDAITAEQLGKVTADDGAADDQFGRSVSVSGNRIVVGALWDDDAYPSDPACNSGSAYLFDSITGEQLHKFTANDADGGDIFGQSVYIIGDTIVVGAPNDDASGSAYVFQVIEATCPADITGDGTVDVLDLLEILSAWGPCA